MKKSKIFMAAGALALAVTAVFATKANKKFTNGGFNTVVASNTNFKATCQYIGSATKLFTTVSKIGTTSLVQLYVNFYTGTSQTSLIGAALEYNGNPTYIK